MSASTCAPDPCGKCADASDDEEEEEDEEDKIPRAEVPVVDKPFDRPVPKPTPPEAFLLSIVLAARSSA